MITADTIADAIRGGFGERCGVRVRRPNAVFQINLPAFMVDGDAAAVFVRPAVNGSVRLTDLGHVRQRLSYRRPVNDEIDTELDRLARRHGLTLDDGEIGTTVPLRDIVPATLGMLQVQTEADATIEAVRSQAQGSEAFRSMVIDALKQAFSNSCHPDFYDSQHDADKEWAIDAVIEGGLNRIAVSVVPSDMEAEHAASVMLFNSNHMDEAIRPNRWVAIPRNMEALRVGSRKRLMRTHWVPVSAFSEDRGLLISRLDEIRH